MAIEEVASRRAAAAVAVGRSIVIKASRIVRVAVDWRPGKGRVWW